MTAFGTRGRAGQGETGERRPSRAVRVYLGLGANLGDRAAALARARALLDAAGIRIVAASKVYEAPPWGGVDQPRFLNQVVEVRTALEPRDLLARCRQIEAALGRVRTVRWGPRVIDVDILLYGGRQVSAADLVIPHPQLARRAFVLVPLAELNGALRVPGRGTVRALLAALPDRGAVKEYAGPSPAPSRVRPASPRT